MKRRRLLGLVPALFVAACSAGELVLPGPPEAASATALQGGARLTWSDVPGADRYVVFGVTSASSAGTTTVDGAVSPLELTDLAGGPWHFRIVAVKDRFRSPASAELSVTPLAVGTAGLVPLDAAASVLSHEDPAAHFGFPAVGAGDVDADGFDDLLVGAMFTSSGGTAHLYRGGPDGLDVAPAWMRASTQTNAHFSKGLASPGDVNGDGWLDLLVGAAEHDGAFSNEGRAWLYPGTGDASFFSGTDIWTDSAGQTSTFMARFVAPAGDVDGDGIDDFVVSLHAHNAPSVNEGRVSVWYGSTEPFPIAPDWMEELDQADAFFGYALSPVRGDADGDGYDDLLAGAWEWDTTADVDAGAVFLYRGGPTGLDADPSWNAVGEGPANRLGGAVSFVGDVNGDGFDDAIAGAHLFEADDRGRAYLFTGGPEGLSPAAAWTYDGVDGEQLGMGVGGAGDVNGDGFADVLVGANASDAGAVDAGRVLLFLGSPSGLAVTPSWEWVGTEADGFAGGAVASAGDVNGDGSDDFAVGVVSFENVDVVDGKVHVFLGPPREGPSVTVGGAGTAQSPFASFTPALPSICTWDWGDGSAPEIVDPCEPSDLVAPAHEFAEPGDHVVRLRVESPYGVTGEAFATY